MTPLPITERREDIYDYIESRSNFSIHKQISRVNFLLYGIYVILSIFLFFLIYYSFFQKSEINYRKSSVRNIQCSFNLSTDDLFFLGLIVLNSFLQTFDLKNIDQTTILTKPLNNTERNVLIELVLININGYNNNLDYLENYVEQVNQYSKTKLCCSSKVCSYKTIMEKALSNSDYFKTFIASDDIYYRKFIYLSKMFSDQYYFILYNRYFYHVNTNSKYREYVKSVFHQILSDNKIFYYLTTTLVLYIDMNTFCLKSLRFLISFPNFFSIRIEN